jgi:predicted nucleic acid-binding protein
MTQGAFLDTGVIIGYCFVGDPHHVPCLKYIGEQSRADFYASQNVEDEYRNKKEELSERSATDILDHRTWVKKNINTDNLGPLDIQNIQNQLFQWGAQTSDYLSNYYQNEVSNFITKDDLLDDLRKIARGFETDAQHRKQQIDDQISQWKQKDNHPDVVDSLSEIHSSDRRICVEAHDLSCHSDHDIELATTNPSDLKDGGREALILTSTQISSVADVSNRN